MGLELLEIAYVGQHSVSSPLLKTFDVSHTAEEWKDMYVRQEAGTVRGGVL